MKQFKNTTKIDHKYVQGVFSSSSGSPAWSDDTIIVSRECNTVSVIVRVIPGNISVAKIIHQDHHEVCPLITHNLTHI